MRIKRTLIAAAVMLCLAGSATAVQAGAAQAATPQCGTSCVSLSSRLFGQSFITNVRDQAQNVGQPVILSLAGSGNPGEDFAYAETGHVSDFYAAGLVSAAVDLHYGGGASGFPDDPAFELQYTPDGVISGLCAGLAVTAANGTLVSLQPCGVSSKTVWIADTGSGVPSGSSYTTLISGSDTNFQTPYVLTALLPGRIPLITHTLHQYGTSPTDFPSQLWQVSGPQP